MTWEGIIPRKRRKAFEQFLRHDDPRVRALAEEMRVEDLASRGLLRTADQLDGVPAETVSQAGAWSNDETEPEHDGGVSSAELPF